MLQCFIVLKLNPSFAFKMYFDVYYIERHIFSKHQLQVANAPPPLPYVDNFLPQRHDHKKPQTQ